MSRVLYHVPSPASPLALAAAEAAECGSVPADDRAALRAALRDGDFGAHELRALSSFLSSSSGGTLSSLLASSAATVRVGVSGRAPGRVATREEEETRRRREAWRAEMRSRAAHREYTGLVADVRKEEVDAAEALGLNLYSQQASIGGSLLVVLVSASLLGYFVGRAIFGADSAKPFVVAIVCGMAMLMVEGVLVVTRLSKVDAASSKSRRERRDGGGALGRALPAGRGLVSGADDEHGFAARVQDEGAEGEADVSPGGLRQRTGAGGTLHASDESVRRLQSLAALTMGGRGDLGVGGKKGV
jgi:hypothetical protein